MYGIIFASILIACAIEEASRRWYVIQRKRMKKEGFTFKWYE